MCHWIHALKASGFHNPVMEVSRFEVRPVSRTGSAGNLFSRKDVVCVAGFRWLSVAHHDDQRRNRRVRRS
jgi:hypothetical protein